MVPIGSCIYFKYKIFVLFFADRTNITGRPRFLTAIKLVTETPLRYIINQFLKN